MLVYRLCISVLLTCELHLIGLCGLWLYLSWFVTSMSASPSTVVCAIPGEVGEGELRHHIMVPVQVIDWKSGLRNDLVLQFVDDDVKPDTFTPPTVQSLYYCATRCPPTYWGIRCNFYRWFSNQTGRQHNVNIIARSCWKLFESVADLGFCKDGTDRAWTQCYFS